MGELVLTVDYRYPKEPTMLNNLRLYSNQVIALISH